jgi:predicted PurR-regulated permease PerM
MNDLPKNLKIDISIKSIIRILVAVFLIYLLMKLTNIILVVLTAIVIASFVEAALNKTKRYIKNRVFAVFLLYLMVIGIFVSLAYVFVPVFVSEMSALVESLAQYIPNDSLFNTFQADTLSGAKDVVSSISSNASLGELISDIQSLTKSLSGGFVEIFGKAFGGVINFGLIFIISFYLSISKDGVENFLRIITPINKEEYVIGLWKRTQKKIGLWIQGQMLLSLIIGILTYLGLTILGVKYSLVISVITALFELIPFGIFISVIPAVVFSYLSGGVTLSILTALLYFILHQFENYLIYPLIIKKVIGIPPLVVILSVIVGWELANFWGVILAIPVAVFLFELLDDLEKKKELT